MDPFSALSIATAVVQFLDFAHFLFKASKKLRETSEYLHHFAFDDATEDLMALQALLRSRPKLSTRQSSSPRREHEKVGCYWVLDPLQALERLLTQVKYRQLTP